jgi:GTP pyrophosphokinase
LALDFIKDYPEQDRQSIESVARSIGEPSPHILGVASILADLQLDADCIISALLLNLFAGEGACKKTIAAQYGAAAAEIAFEAVEASRISSKEQSSAEAEKIRKMLFAMIKDIRVIFICLADKLQTMRTLHELSFPPSEGKAQPLAATQLRKKIAQECLDIYAPLANRFGLSGIKDEMEDLCLKHLNKEAFLHIKQIVALKLSERQGFLESIKKEILACGQKNGIDMSVESRAKHFYSIYQKIRKRNKEAGELYDLFGIRLLCNSPEDCYTLLGIVHKLWKPIDGRFKDYIAMPKPNGYQSLHTTVLAFDPQQTPGMSSSPGNMLEIQIRTFAMHQTAEYGYASHWLYKKGKSSEVIEEGNLGVVNSLMDIIKKHNEIDLDELKKEVLKDSIYVWTPQGKVIELPQGATPIDFAYNIHSAIGDHCTLAKADGIIIPLNAELRNTQIVEIITSQAAHPTINWLRIAKTAKARGKIRSYLAQSEGQTPPDKTGAAKKTKDAGGADAKSSTDENTKSPITSLHASINPIHVRVQDEKNLLLRFAKCCNPVLGDKIVGYVSRGRGIIVHRENCKALAHIPDFAERRIETEWEQGDSPIARIKIEAHPTADLFSEIDTAVKKCGGSLVEGRLMETNSRTGAHHLSGFFTLQLENKEDLKKALKSIRTLPNIFNIQLVGF